MGHLVEVCPVGVGTEGHGRRPRDGFGQGKRLVLMLVLMLEVQLQVCALVAPQLMDAVEAGAEREAKLSAQLVVERSRRQWETNLAYKNEARPLTRHSNSKQTGGGAEWVAKKQALLLLRARLMMDAPVLWPKRTKLAASLIYIGRLHYLSPQVRCHKRHLITP